MDDCFSQNRGVPSGKESCPGDIRSPAEGGFLGGKTFSCGMEGGMKHSVQEWNALPPFSIGFVGDVSHLQGQESPKTQENAS